MLLKTCLFALFFLCSQCFAFSQCSILNVNSNSSACVNENLSITTSATASSYEWDFCTGDLTQRPISRIRTAGTLPTPYDISVVKEANNWQLFYVSYNANSVSRVNLGADLQSGSGQEFAIGNPNGLLSNPTSIKVKRFNGLWYGLISSQSNGSLVLLQFGSSLSNTPSASLIASNLSNFEGALDVVQTGANSFLVFISNSGGNIIVLDFPNGLDGGFSSTNTISVGGYLVDLQIIQTCNGWSIFLLRFDTRTLIRLDFGNSLTNSPTQITYPSNLFAFGPYRFWVGKDGDYITGLAANINGGIANFDIGLDLNNLNPGITDFGNLNGVISNSWSIEAFKVQNRWTGLTMNGNSSNLVSLSFPEISCGASIPTYSLQNPRLVSYNSSGTKYPTLTVTYGDGSTESKTFPITVQSNVASPLQISTQESYCVNSSLLFDFQTPGIVSNISWDFGDGGSATSQNPTHSYFSAGIYYPSISITSSNGCKNLARDTVMIFNQPQASFSLPSVTPLCTNQSLTFTNTTPSIGTTIGWQWSVNGNNVSTVQNLSSLFSSTGPQTINLQASIPGCSSAFSQTINSLIEGPLANFTAPSASCLQGSVSFSNTTIGSVTGYQWTFGDGNTSTSTNASNTYANIGMYQVTLQASNAAGCQNTATKSINIYSKPQPDFAIGLPPFSCAGTPSQFTDQTPAPTDSNITAWQWAFGDPASGTSNTRNPTYIYSTAGTYNVSLTATTNFGCSSAIQKAVTISASPQAAFTNSVACVSQPTQFTDGSSGSIRSRLWTIQGNSFTTPNVQFAFVAPGSYPVLLTITGTNNCTSQVAKSIVVPVLPTLDFSVQAACNTNPTLFSEITTGADAPVSQAWNFASLGTGTGAAAQFTFNTPGNYAVQLRSTRQSGCVYSVTKNVSVIQGPVADFNPSVDVGGPPLPVTFVNTSTGATSYLWRFGDAANTTSSAVNPSFIFSDLGIYAVKLTASNATGCSFTTSKPITVLVPNINLVLSDFKAIADASGILQPTVSIFNNGNLPVTNPDLLIDVASAGLVRKRLNARILPNQTVSVPVDLQIVPRSADYICAELVVPNNNADFDRRRCLPLGSDEILFAPYPNPAADIVNFDWVSIQARPVSVIVFSPGGSEVFRQQFESIAAGLNRLQIKTTELPNGLYYILYSDGTTTKSFSFAVAKN